ncbi:MAG: DUF2029 domain-containing protein [Chloroflexi bacterium]|nr:DUF2029 domain-containing protein [Chloroflexota bacterium]
MGRADRRSGILLTALGVVLAGLALVSALDPDHPPGSVEGNDFVVFYEGARGYTLTGNPYGAGFVSPAPFAFLLVPLVTLTPTAAASVWLGLSVAALTAIAAASPWLAAIPRWPVGVLPLAGLLCLWPASAYGLLLGQSSAAVGLCATLAVAAARGRPAVAGALLGFAVVAKPHLVVLLAAGLACQEWRDRRRCDLARALLVTGIGLVGATALYSRRWIEVLSRELPTSWNYWGSTIGSNVFLSAALEDRTAGWFVWASLAAALLVGVAVWWWRDAPAVEPFAGALLAASLLVTPYAYPHDYVLLALPLVWVAGRLWELARGLGPVLVVGLGGLAWFVPRPALYDDERFGALLLPAVLLALIVGLWARQERTQTVGPSDAQRPARTQPR